MRTTLHADSTANVKVATPNTTCEIVATFLFLPDKQLVANKLKKKVDKIWHKQSAVVLKGIFPNQKNTSATSKI